MRLFIAISLEEDVKDILCDTMLRLKGHALQGSYTKRENLHLTLAFLGETVRLEAAKEAMRQVESDSFRLLLEGLGVFRRDRGDCYWMGVACSHSLMTLRERLYKELRRREFKLEQREFRPHLTLARGVLMADSFDRQLLAASLPPMVVPVRHISLMRSDRVGGKLVYTEMFRKELS